MSATRPSGFQGEASLAGARPVERAPPIGSVGPSFVTPPMQVLQSSVYWFATEVDMNVNGAYARAA